MIIRSRVNDTEEYLRMANDFKDLISKVELDSAIEYVEPNFSTYAESINLALYVHIRPAYIEHAQTIKNIIAISGGRCWPNQETVYGHFWFSF